jgi:hypothetical protein
MTSADDVCRVGNVEEPPRQLDHASANKQLVSESHCIDQTIKVVAQLFAYSNRRVTLAHND